MNNQQLSHDIITPEVAEAPQDLRDRRVEITGPAEPKMMINAMNSGAQVFMADLEDAQKSYFLNEKTATLLFVPGGCIWRKRTFRFAEPRFRWPSACV